MKRKVSLIFLLVGLIIIGSLTIVAEANAHPLDGTWTVNYYWSSSTADMLGNEGVEPLGTAINVIKMYTAKFGTVDIGDGSGFNKHWVLNPSPKVVILVLNSGCYPLYISKNFNGVDYMSGSMSCREGSGSGTWNATKQ